MNKKDQEKRFLKWVNSRDDDWWEDQARIDIWDFRVMQDFFNEDFTQALSQSKKDVIEEIKKMKRKEFKLIPGGVQKCSKNHTWFCDCPAYNEAIDDILLSLKDKWVNKTKN